MNSDTASGGVEPAAGQASALYLAAWPPSGGGGSRLAWASQPTRRLALTLPAGEPVRPLLARGGDEA